MPLIVIKPQCWKILPDRAAGYPKTPINQIKLKGKEMETYTIEEVREMLLRAFDRGEAWGVTYGGWFSPSKEDREERRKNEIDKVLGQE